MRQPGGHRILPAGAGCRGGMCVPLPRG
uniref:Uncharacterized protein n=1 Tax=Arundo donax TaxID=35708 RepID=A0A0A9BKH2_ARUDO